MVDGGAIDSQQAEIGEGYCRIAGQIKPFIVGQHAVRVNYSCHTPATLVILPLKGIGSMPANDIRNYQGPRKFPE